MTARIEQRLAALRQQVADLRSRVTLSMARGVLRLGEDDHGLRQTQVGLLHGEVRGEIEHLEAYGLTAAPQPGAEAVVLFLGGERDHPLVLSTPDRRHRPRDLQGGEVCLYAAAGQRITLLANGDVRVYAPGKTVTAECATLILKGNLEVEGNIHATGSIIDDAGNTNHHGH